MPEALFQFYAELKDLLSPRKQAAFAYPFKGEPSVKHMIEALGIPHTEVYAIQANGKPVDFSYPVHDRDRIEVFPVSQAGRLPPQARLQPRPPNPPRFLLDIHLGKLAVYLRILGFDTWYRNDYEDAELARLAGEHTRVLLSRDRRLMMRKQVVFGYLLRSLDPEEQAVEVLRRYDLEQQMHPFQRCLRCNGELQPVEKAQIVDRLEPLTRRYYSEFHICPDCQQIYWKGSHYERMLRLIERLRNGIPSTHSATK